MRPWMDFWLQCRLSGLQQLRELSPTGSTGIYAGIGVGHTNDTQMQVCHRSTLDVSRRL